MDDKYKLLTSILDEVRVKREEKLADHTFSKLGGNAQFFYIATTILELTQALNTALNLNLPYLILGSGTKLLLSSDELPGLSIKNRTTLIKLGGIKGKVGREGIGIEEALVETDSGVTIGKLNEFLSAQKLKPLQTICSQQSTVGGSIFVDSYLKSATSKIIVWDQGDVMEVSVEDLKRDQIVLTVTFKIKAKNI